MSGPRETIQTDGQLGKGFSRRAIGAALIAGLLLGAGATYTLAGASLTRTTTTTTTLPPITSTSTTTTTSIVASSVTITNSTATIDNRAFASTANDTLGLEITLMLNATQLTPGKAINITLAVRNLLPKTLNLSTSAEDWRLTALADGGDSYGYCVGEFPFDMEIFAGHFTESNITLGAPINVEVKYAIPYCKIAVPANDTFDPLVDESPLRDVTSGYSVNNESFTFQPGPYTVVAGDRWGQIVILNFVVGQADQ